MSATCDILFLPISGLRGASSRYRVHQYLPALDAAGLTYAFALPPAQPGRGLRRVVGAWQHARALVRLAATARVTFLQKRLLPEALVTALARRSALVFDFDDAIFTSPDSQRSDVARRRVERRLQHTLRSAQLVIAGNRMLADYARHHNVHVAELPTVIDTTRYPAKDHIATTEPVIGWIGHSVNHPYLAGMAEAFRALARQQPFRLLVVSDRDIEIPGLTVDNRRWSESSEVTDLLAMDIGIMPMPDDPWSRGKCGLKALQYMASGLPVVCAPVGANAEIVRHGEEGFLATTTAEWVRGLATLCADPDLRARCGKAGRTRVEAAYSLQSAAPVLMALLVPLLRR